MKKDVLARAYVSTLLVIAIMLIIGQFVIQDSIGTRRRDARIVNVSSRLEALSQQITKAAIAMQLASNQNQFFNYQKEIREASKQFDRYHRALQRGDRSLGFSTIYNPPTVVAKLEELKFTQLQIESASRALGNVSWDDPLINRQQVVAGSINDLLQAERRFTPIIKEITGLYLSEAVTHKGTYSQAEFLLLGLVILVLVLQAIFIFRPVYNLAGHNYLSASKAFRALKGSEAQLKVSLAEQQKANRRLVYSQKELEKKNHMLQTSEKELMLSTQRQIEVNAKLIEAQEQLKQAYDQLKDSEEEVRGLAKKQLEGNEKLWLAEKELQQVLQKEQANKRELENALASLKNTQSQLVMNEKMASLGQLTAGIAHEINNPINFVYNGIDTLKTSLDDLLVIVDKYQELDNGKANAEVVKEIQELKEDYDYDFLIEGLREIIDDIREGAVRTIEIVKGLRIFSRLDEEQMKMANINENLDATLVLLKNKTKNRIAIDKFYDNNLNEINCYPGQLNQVFMNILTNAIQAIPDEREDGKIQIYTEDAGDQVVVRIKDNGNGMPEEVRKRIFEPFFTTKPVGIGTGLGLSISYGIVEKHEGKIEVNSNDGEGTEFVITVPSNLEERIPNGEQKAKDSQPMK